MSTQEVKRDVMRLTVCLCVQLPEIHANSCDNISQFSVDSITSLESKEPVFIAAGDIRCLHARTHAHPRHGGTCPDWGHCCSLLQSPTMHCIKQASEIPPVCQLILHVTDPDSCSCHVTRPLPTYRVSNNVLRLFSDGACRSSWPRRPPPSNGIPRTRRPWP